MLARVVSSPSLVIFTERRIFFFNKEFFFSLCSCTRSACDGLAPFGIPPVLEKLWPRSQGWLYVTKTPLFCLIIFDQQ